MKIASDWSLEWMSYIEIMLNCQSAWSCVSLISMAFPVKTTYITMALNLTLTATITLTLTLAKLIIFVLHRVAGDFYPLNRRRITAEAIIIIIIIIYYVTRAA